MIPGKYCPWIEVSGANAKWCPSCNGKYTKSKTEESNGTPVYVGQYERLIIIYDPKYGYWSIETKNYDENYEKTYYYEKTSIGGGAEGEYESITNDGSIGSKATVKCEK